MFLICSLWVRNDHHIVSVRNQRELGSERLSQSALDAISDHGVSNLLAHRQRNSTRTIRLGCVHDQDAGQTDSTTRSLHPLNVPGQPQAAFTGKTQRSALAALAGDSWDQALTTLGAATLDDIPTTGGLHPGTEAVASLALDVARLVCALHLNLQGS